MELLDRLDALVGELALVQLDALEDGSLRAMAVGVERLAGQLRGIASQALGQIERRVPDGCAWWWRDETGLSGEAAGYAVRRSRDLRSMPVVSDAVVTGEISLEKAAALTGLVGRLDPQLIESFEPELVAGAKDRTVSGIHSWVRFLIAQNSEQDLVDEQAAAEAIRMLQYRLGPDGVVRGRFAIPAGAFEPVAAVIEPLARKQGEHDTRTAAQRRADALVDVFEAAARWMDLPQAGGQPVHVSYVLGAEWAAGQEGAPPAAGAWMGPMTRARAEAALCDARLHRVLLDENGQVRSLEAVNDQITRAQRRAVAARDQSCVAHGCNRPPAFCDVHHLISREDGGPTVLDNLALLCRRHHVMWHEGRILLPHLRVPWLRKPLDPPMVA
ncbi:MAG: endonuclease [Frankiales bacterium]|nr:endonuclease [Frankiales bacterium]